MDSSIEAKIKYLLLSFKSNYENNSVIINLHISQYKLTNEIHSYIYKDVYKLFEKQVETSKLLFLLT